MNFVSFTRLRAAIAAIAKRLDGKAPAQHSHKIDDLPHELVQTPNGTNQYTMETTWAEYLKLREKAKIDPGFKLVHDRTNYKVPDSPYDNLGGSPVSGDGIVASKVIPSGVTPSLQLKIDRYSSGLVRYRVVNDIFPETRIINNLEFWVIPSIFRPYKYLGEQELQFIAGLTGANHVTDNNGTSIEIDSGAGDNTGLIIFDSQRTEPIEVTSVSIHGSWHTDEPMTGRRSFDTELSPEAKKKVRAKFDEYCRMRHKAVD